jgi:MoaA/NifB/PqqE/SkfB family radical SAM enzyme
MEKGISTEKFDKREELREDKLNEILHSARLMGVKAINFTGGGEPMLHPNIEQILINSIDTFDTSLITNGVLVTEAIAKDVISHMSWCRVSLDAATPKTYRIIRRVSEEQMYIAIRAIRDIVKHKGDCTVGVGFVATDLNYAEIYEAAELAKMLGVDNIRISIAYGLKSDQTWMVRARNLAEHAMELQDDTFTVFNTMPQKVFDIDRGVQDYDRCYVKDLQAYIGADSNVYMCCTYAYNDQGLLGSLADQTFQYLWEGKHKEDIYEHHNPQHHCKIPCQYRHKNEFIGYCLKENPKHVNFI